MPWNPNIDTSQDAFLKRLTALEGLNISALVTDCYVWTGSEIQRERYSVNSRKQPTIHCTDNSNIFVICALNTRNNIYLILATTTTKKGPAAFLLFVTALIQSSPRLYGALSDFQSLKKLWGLLEAWCIYEAHQTTDQRMFILLGKIRSGRSKHILLNFFAMISCHFQGYLFFNLEHKDSLESILLVSGQLRSRQMRRHRAL